MVLSFFLLLFFVSLVGLNIGWVLANRFVFIFGVYYLCTYEDRLRFGIAKSEIKFPFVSALFSLLIIFNQYYFSFLLSIMQPRNSSLFRYFFRIVCVQEISHSIKKCFQISCHFHLSVPDITFRKRPAQITPDFL